MKLALRFAALALPVGAVLDRPLDRTPLERDLRAHGVTLYRRAWSHLVEETPPVQPADLRDMERSRDMARRRYLGHRSPGGATARDRVERQGIVP
jgi:hypothetical protein